MRKELLEKIKEGFIQKCNEFPKGIGQIDDDFSFCLDIDDYDITIQGIARGYVECFRSYDTPPELIGTVHFFPDTAKFIDDNGKEVNFTKELDNYEFKY